MTNGEKFPPVRRQKKGIARFNLHDLGGLKLFVESKPLVHSW
jgi:hypothetical protein